LKRLNPEFNFSWPNYAEASAGEAVGSWQENYFYNQEQESK
jgi:hypothetical protein